MGPRTWALRPRRRPQLHVVIRLRRAIPRRAKPVGDGQLPSEGKEGIDRQAIVAAPDQEDFVRRVIAVNPRTSSCCCEFPYAMPWRRESATTVLQATHASQELGNALRRV